MAYTLDVSIDADVNVHCLTCDEHDRVIAIGALFNPLIGSVPLTVIIGGSGVQARDLGVEWEKPYLTAIFKCDRCDVVFYGHVFFNDPDKPPVMVVVAQDEDTDRLAALIDGD
jgi:hypothetical protein